MPLNWWRMFRCHALEDLVDSGRSLMLIVLETPTPTPTSGLLQPEPLSNVSAPFEQNRVYRHDKDVYKHRPCNSVSKHAERRFLIWRVHYRRSGWGYMGRTALPIQSASWDSSACLWLWRYEYRAMRQKSSRWWTTHLVKSRWTRPGIRLKRGRVTNEVIVYTCNTIWCLF